MRNDDDADIDALMGAVVGQNGQAAAFPEPPTPVVPIRSARGLRKKQPKAKQSSEAEFEGYTDADIDAAVEAVIGTPEQIIARISAELTGELAKNEAERIVIDPRTIPVRFSRLKHMSASAAHYFQACQDDNEDTIAMRFGRGFHALCLGTPVKRWTGKNRNSNDYKTFVKKNPGVEILMPKEWESAHGMFESIMRHATARELLFGKDVIREQTIEWQFGGRKCTSRPDARLGTQTLVDLKSTMCSEPRKFQKDAIFRAYHSQFSFYGHASADAFGAFPDNSLCVAVEKKKPYVVTVLELPKETLDEGEKAWRLWWEQLMVCEAANTWPGYTEAIEKIEVFDTGDVSLIIDGEEHSFDD